MAIIAKQRAILIVNCCLNLTKRLLRLYRRRTILPTSRTGHLVDETEWLAMAYTSPHPLPVKEGRPRPRNRNMIYVRTWTKRLARPDPSIDPGTVPPHGTMVIKPNMPATYQFGANTEHYNRRTHATTQPNTGVLHTPCASPMRCWITNFQNGLNP